MNTSSTGACAICAWRQDCKKKFTLSGRDIRCPEFVKDLSIREPESRHDDEAGGKGELKS
ncbi:MAG TPA: hypothetical protein DCP92_11255 [Nitrospiraceae bacterium]|nr:hypothetical protein [Nitrospiraceae bacterium]